MSDPSDRATLAGLLRAIGHTFVGAELSDTELAHLTATLADVRAQLAAAPPRVRTRPAGTWESFRLSVPERGRQGARELFGDSIVSGGANPMGLGAVLWRDGDEAVTEVTLGRAFEGAPQRAHGGVVAALIDETMGLVLAIHESLAFTARLNITYLAPTPINATLLARARLDHRDGRKLTMSAEVTHDGVVLATATALFIEVDPTRFLASPPSVG
jgi:acyl-coenzyme A thioesterase PaaI-like protein